MIMSHLQALEQRLEELVPSLDTSYGELTAAARYSLLKGGGKRLRPQLLFAVTEMLGGSFEIALDPACALEMIHTYSLIHDDLPCMDDDDLRRGIPTLHKVHGEAIALLAGDYLQTRAYETLSQASDLTAEQKVEMISVLTNLSGAHGMIGGQVIDIRMLDKNTSPDILEQTHLLKTGALIGASLVLGAIAAGAEMAIKANLEKIGFNLGLAFQVVDDVLDRTCAEKKRGKEEGSDRERGHRTYVDLLGVNGAQDYAEKLLKEVLEAISSLGKNTKKLQALAVSLVRRNR